MGQLTRSRAASTIIALATLTASCQNGQSDQSASEIFDDIAHGKSAGAQVSSTGHALCIDASDLIAFIGRGDDGSDADKTKEARQTALFEQNRCTFISGGVHYDVDADGREIYHTPHGTLALWPTP